MIAWLKNWVITISTALIFITAIELILPDNKMKKYAKFVLGLMLMTVILNPILKLFNEKQNITAYIEGATKDYSDEKYKSDLNKYKEIDKNNTISVFKINIENSVNKLLKEKFSKGSYKVEVEALEDKVTNMIIIKQVSIGVQNGMVENVKKIEIGNNKNNVNNKEVIDNEESRNIKEYLSNELKISKDSILVYKL